MPTCLPFSGAEAEKIVSSMLGTMVHRGPDGFRLWRDFELRCVLGHRRLGRGDHPGAGTQPVSTVDRRWRVTCDGKIYNFPDLAGKLGKAGMILNARNDSEVLAAAIGLWGADAATSFDGMFAFAAFDTKTGDAVLARDAFGEKPLYYMPLPHRGLAFASELQALEKVPGFDYTADINAVAELLSFQYIGAPRTIYSNVLQLPPGHVLEYSGCGTIKIRRYFEFVPGLYRLQSWRMDELVDELEDILLTSLNRRANAPIGAFLSCDIASPLLCALMRFRLGRDLTTFSVRFREFAALEDERAQAIADHLEAEHRVLVLDFDEADFVRNIASFIDQPIATNSCFATYMLSQFARNYVPRIISGDGGAELFGGSYLTTTNEQHEFIDRQRTYDANALLAADEMYLQQFLGLVPEGFADQIASLRSRVNSFGTDVLAAFHKLEIDYRLPGAVLAKIDRMSMNNSLEIRKPYLNAQLAHFAERLPHELLMHAGKRKALLSKLARRYLPRDLVDMTVKEHPPPVIRFEGLLAAASKLLEDENSRLREAIGSERIRAFMQEQHSQSSFRPDKLRAALLLEAWLRYHPAKINLDPKKPARKASKLIGEHLGSNVFLILPNKSPELEYTKNKRLPIRLLERTAELIGQGSSTIPRGTIIEIPDWECGVSLQQAPVFEGSTCVLRWNGSFTLGDEFLRYLSPLGVERVIFDSTLLLTDECLCRNSGLFDQNWYLARYPAIAAAAVDPLTHYLKVGGYEGRDPSPSFSSKWYLEKNPDVAASGLNPLVHYLRFGAEESRKPNPHGAVTLPNNEILLHDAKDGTQWGKLLSWLNTLLSIRSSLR